MTRLAIRVGSALLRVTGTAAGVLAIVLLAIGLLGLAAVGPVDEAVCDYGDTETCKGPEWIPFAVLAGGVLALVLGLLFLPVWFVHLGQRRHLRRQELLASPRLQALDSWLMSGNLPAPLHADLRDRLRTLSALGHPAQLARAAGGLLAGVSFVLLVLGLAVAGTAGSVAGDRNYCEEVEDLCALAQTGLAVGTLVTVLGGVGLVAGLVTAAAGRRQEAAVRARFEADWDQSVAQGAQANRPRTARAR